ncbi:MAG TPA: hypothetical protein EYP85_07610 [Armatimonadetes bacterium]|nr:hypothetical protein [Armatimonadota bacterium]
MPHQLLTYAQPRVGEEWLLRVLAERLDAEPLAPCRVVVPSVSLARYLERRLLTCVSGVGGRVFATLPQLAAEALAEMDKPRPRRLSETLRRWVLARLIREALAESDFLGRIRHYPGFVAAVDELLADLRQARIPPEILAAVASRRNSRKLRELAQVASVYRDWLATRDLTDAAGEFEEAIEAVPASEGLRRYDPLVVFAFDDFTPAQFALLQALTEAQGAVTFLVPYDEARSELFAPVEKTLGRLRDLTGVEPTPLPAEPPTTALAHIQTYVFAPAAPAAMPEEKVILLEASGPAQMVEAIARELRRQQRADPTLRWADCAVVFRQLAPYTALVREVFPRFGLPFDLPQGTPWRELRVLTLVRALLELKRSVFAKEPLLACLRSVYCRGMDDSVALARLEAVLPAHAPPPTLAEALRRVAAGFAQEAREPDEEEPDPLAAQRAKRLRRAAETLPAAWQTVADLPERATLTEYAAAVRRLVNALVRVKEVNAGRDGSPDENRDSNLRFQISDFALRDGRALDELDARLRALGQEWPEPVNFDELLTLFDLLLQTELLPSPRPRRDAVSVRDVFGVRGLSFRLLILAGLLEKEFPAWVRPSPFLDDEERRALVDAAGEDTWLPLTAERAARERLLFLRALHAATERVLLAYPHTDAEGKPTVLSPFIAEVKRLFAPEGDPDRADLPTRTYTVADVLPVEPGDLWQAEEAVAWASDRLFRDLPRRSEAEAGNRLLSAAAALLGETYPHGPPWLGLAAEWPRWHQPDFTAYDGDLSAEENLLAHLRQRWVGRPLSPTKLDHYGQCPWKFFAAQVLGLKAPEVEELEITALDRGRLFHTVLERFYRARWDAAARRARPLTEAEEEAAVENILALAEEVCAEYEAQGRVGHPGAWRYEKQRLLARLRWFVSHEIEHFKCNPGFAPAYLEFSFGLREHRGRDPASRETPLALATASGEVRLRGILDRVDADAVGRALVMDYKTGSQSSVPTGPDVQAGLSFQLFIYLLAAEELLGLDPAEAYYLLVAQPPGKKGMLSRLGKVERRKVSRAKKGFAVEGNPAWEELRERMWAFLSAYAADIAAGHFPLLPYPPRPEKACKYCDFKAVCRMDETRLLVEKAEAKMRFARLRAMGGDNDDR